MCKGSANQTKSQIYFAFSELLLEKNDYLCARLSKNMNMYFTGIIIAVMTFLTIGIWHPIVIKAEYYWGTRPWVVFLLIGVCCCVGALFIENIYLSSFLGVFGASSLWGIGELFSQKKRVEKGWFPMNPKRKDEYGQ